MENPLLRIENLGIHFNTYDGEAKVINDVNIQLKKGEVIAIVGESGCGKSVTVRAILGLLSSSSAKYVRGDISLEGKSLLNLSDREWRAIRGRKIAMIFQDPMSSLNPVFTIGEQLIDAYIWQGKRGFSFGLPSRKKELKKRARNRAIEILEKMRIPDPEGILNRYPYELSGGMRQRILIALALVHNPQILIADEPGTALDVSVQDQILIELKRLVKEEGISMIFITHNLGVAKMVSDHIYVMYAGEVIEDTRTELLFKKQCHPYTEGLLSSVPKLNGKMGVGIDGRIPNFINPPAGCRFYERCPKRMEVCATVPPKSVDVDDERNVKCHLFD